MVHVESPTTTTTRAVVSAAYAAAGNSDMAAILEILDPDVILHEPASLPNAGVHRGLQNVLQALAYVFEAFDMSLLTVDELIVDGERAVGLDQPHLAWPRNPEQRRRGVASARRPSGGDSPVLLRHGRDLGADHLVLEVIPWQRNRWGCGAQVRLSRSRAMVRTWISSVPP